MATKPNNRPGKPDVDPGEAAARRFERGGRTMSKEAAFKRIRGNRTPEQAQAAAARELEALVALILASPRRLPKPRP